MIRTIIIEDEENSRLILSDTLHEHFPNIQIIATCKNNSEAKSAIEELKPDLVLSDIELKHESVFTMLQQLSNIDFEIIFITGYDRYAIQAIKFSALDYLLKPFSKNELAEAIQHYEQNNIKSNPRNSLMRYFITLRTFKKILKRLHCQLQMA